MRRLIAIVLVLAFAAATAASARAAGRLPAPPHGCCCDAPHARGLCKSDCCKVGHASRLLADVRRQERGLGPAVRPFLELAAAPALAWPPMQQAGAAWLVGLHERAAPRLPLRV